MSEPIDISALTANLCDRLGFPTNRVAQITIDPRELTITAIVYTENEHGSIHLDDDGNVAQEKYTWPVTT